VDLLDRLLEHDAWTTGQLIDCCRSLSDQQLDHHFDIGHQSIRATLHHIIFNMEAWSAAMAGADPATVDSSADDSLESLAARLTRAAADLARVATSVRARDGWDELWVDLLDDPPAEKSYGGAIAHVITHSMHHRAQLLYMLKRLGLTGLPEGDVLTWEQRKDPAVDSSS
jgi:uncharacterized damage-inducible protein DinB